MPEACNERLFGLMSRIMQVYLNQFIPKAGVGSWFCEVMDILWRESMSWCYPLKQLLDVIKTEIENIYTTKS
jgi:hypothetical protein